MKNKKKGFTLVELLVVIAILAVLATVSILGYTAFTKKATISNDETLCAQMNLILQASEQGEQISSFNDVVDVMKENGFILANLNPSTDGYYFIWNSETNRMMLSDEKAKITYPEECTDEVVNENWYFALSTVEDKTKLETIIGTSTGNIIYAPEDYSTLLNDFNSTTGAGSKGGDVILAKDIVVNVSSTSNRMTVNCENKTVNFDLSGDTIRSEGENGWAGGRAINVTKGTLNLKNGTIDVSNDAYGGVLVNGGILNIENVTLYNRKANGLSIKVTAGSAVVSNCTIYSDLGGGITADLDDGKTGNIVVKNCTVVQTGAYAAYGQCIAIGAANDTNAKIVVESGTYSSEHNHVLAVWNSGGTIEIKGGTFTGNTEKKLISIDYPNHTVHIDHSSIIISGGTFNGEAFSVHSTNTAENIDYWKSLCTNSPTVTINDGVVTISYTNIG